MLVHGSVPTGDPVETGAPVLLLKTESSNKKQIWEKFPINLRSGEFLGIFAYFLGIF